MTITHITNNMTHIIKFSAELDLFVKQNSLQPADAIVVRKMPTKLLRHYILYLGFYNGHIFMANTLTGVKVYTYLELLKDLQTFIPEKIERFVGTIQERKQAVERALSRKDENSYNLILNNCEHFKNWVQKGEHKSQQVEDIGKVTMAIGAGIAIGGAAKNNEGAALTGLGILLLGGLAWAMSQDESNKPPSTHYPRRNWLDE